MVIRPTTTASTSTATPCSRRRRRSARTRSGSPGSGRRVSRLGVRVRSPDELVGQILARYGEGRPWLSKESLAYEAAEMRKLVLRTWSRSAMNPGAGTGCPGPRRAPPHSGRDDLSGFLYTGPPPRERRWVKVLAAGLVIAIVAGAVAAAGAFPAEAPRRSQDRGAAERGRDAAAAMAALARTRRARVLAHNDTLTGSPTAFTSRIAAVRASRAAASEESVGLLFSTSTGSRT